MHTNDRRAHERERLALPMILPDGRRAMTRNVCERGLYLVLPADAQLDTWVLVQVSLPGVPVAMSALAEVIRTEAHPRGVGVALRLHAHELHTRHPGRPWFVCHGLSPRHPG